MKSTLTKNLAILTNDELCQNLKSLVGEERNLLAEILWHLREIERRRLYLDLSYPSLFEYCVKHLDYSQGAAFRRISAMHLLKEIPDMETQLKDGTLNLTQISQAQEYFKREKKIGTPLRVQQKIAVLHSLQGKSTRECEQLLVARNPQVAPSQERERIVTDELTEIKFLVSKRMMEKIKRLKEIRSHTNPNPSYAELFEMLLDSELKRKNLTPSKQESLPAPKVESDRQPRQQTSLTTQKIKSPRSIPMDLKRAIYTRDHGKCTFKNLKNQRTCGSTFQLQIDHILPIAKNGKTELANLRLLCRAHNIHEAHRILGSKMKKWASND